MKKILSIFLLCSMIFLCSCAPNESSSADTVNFTDALGREVKVGEGMANIPEVIKRLRAVGYRGNFIIEREISGEEQI